MGGDTRDGHKPGACLHCDGHSMSGGAASYQCLRPLQTPPMSITSWQNCTSVGFKIKARRNKQQSHPLANSIQELGTCISRTTNNQRNDLGKCIGRTMNNQKKKMAYHSAGEVAASELWTVFGRQMPHSVRSPAPN
jgi:hypothetical protein